MRSREETREQQREEHAPEGAVPKAGRVAALLALQRSAGNAAVTRALARQVIDFKSGNPGPYKDTVHGEVTVLEELPGVGSGPLWLKLKAKDDGKDYLYVPAGALGDDERYVLWKGVDGNYKNLHKQATAKATKASSGPSSGATTKSTKERKEELKSGSEKAEAIEDTAVRDALAKGTWAAKHKTQLERQKETHKPMLEFFDDMILALEWLVESLAWPAPYKAIGDRAALTFDRLADGILADTLEITPDLIGKLHQVAAPLRPKVKKKPQDFDEDEMREISQALAELDYAGIVVAKGDLSAPFVLGAQSRQKGEEQKVGVEPEVQHGALPPLHIMGLEVDGYYRDKAGVLHADEVKDTPRALGDKLKRGAAQLNRQLEWLALNVYDEQKQLIPKRVGYFVRGTGPYFDQLLAEHSMAAFKRLHDAVKGGVILRIGDEDFTYDQIKKIYDDTVSWLHANETALGADPETTRGGGKYDLSKVAKKYLHTLEMTRVSIATKLAAPTTTQPDASTAVKINS